MGQTVSSLALAPTGVTGGSIVVGTVTLSSNAPEGGTLVSLSSANSAATTPQAITVPAGSASAVFNISTVPVPADSAGLITARTGSVSRSRTLTVRAPALKALSVTPNEVYGGKKTTGLIELTGPAPVGGIRVSLSANSSVASVSSSVTVAAGEAIRNFAVTTTIPQTFSVSVRIAANYSGVEKVATVSVLRPGLFDSAPWPRYRGSARQSGFTDRITSLGDWGEAIGSAISSSPAIGSDGTVYVGANNGRLYALDGATGLTKWSFATGRRIQASPVLTGTQVFIGSADGWLYCLSTLTGQLVWKFQTGGPIVSTPCIGNDDRIYFGSFDRFLYAISRKTGQLVWRFKTGGAVNSSPNLSADGTLYVGSNDGRMYAFDTTANKALVKWSFLTGAGVESSPAVHEGRVVFGSYDGNVYCLEANTGLKLWEFATSWSVYSSPALDTFGRVVVGSDDGAVYCLDSVSGYLIWSYQTGDMVGGSPAVDKDGFVYANSSDSNVYLLSKNGILIRTDPRGSLLDVSPLVLRAGFVLNSTSTSFQQFRLMFPLSNTGTSLLGPIAGGKVDPMWTFHFGTRVGVPVVLTLAGAFHPSWIENSVESQMLGTEDKVYAAGAAEVVFRQTFDVADPSIGVHGIWTADDGMQRIAINGKDVGINGEGMAADSVAVASRWRGFDIPPSELRDGQNTIEFVVNWNTSPYNGFRVEFGDRAFSRAVFKVQGYELQNNVPRWIGDHLHMRAGFESQCLGSNRTWSLHSGDTTVASGSIGGNKDWFFWSQWIDFWRSPWDSLFPTGNAEFRAAGGRMPLKGILNLNLASAFANSTPTMLNWDQTQNCVASNGLTLSVATYSNPEPGVSRADYEFWLEQPGRGYSIGWSAIGSNTVHYTSQWLTPGVPHRVTVGYRVWRRIGNTDYSTIRRSSFTVVPR